MGSNEEAHHTNKLTKDETSECRLPESPQEHEDDDGPPPGFNSVPVDLSIDKNKEPEDDDDDDDGPPPGFQTISLTKNEEKEKEKEKYQLFEEEEDDDGPPPGFHPVHVPKQDGDVSIPIEPEKVDVSNPISQLGFQSISLIEEEKSGDGFKLGLQSISVEESELGLQSNTVKGEEKVEISSEVGFQLVLTKEEEREGDESEIGSQPISMIEDEKAGNVCATGSHSISEKEIGENINDNDDDDDEGPPPGWGSFPLPRPPIESPSPRHQPLSAVSPGTGPESAHIKDEKARDDFEVGSQSYPTKEEEREPQIGFQPIPMNEHEKEDIVCGNNSHLISEKEVCENDDDDDEGPPPGWGSFRTPRPLIESPPPPHQPMSSVSPGTGSESAHVKEAAKMRDDFEFGSQSDPIKEEEKERDGSEMESQSFPVKNEKWSSPVKEEKEEDEDEGPPPGWDSFPPPRPPGEASSPLQLPPLNQAPPRPRLSATSSGKCQMVCGSCRRLLSYSKGSKFVQCSCCQTINLVLEEHQVGQVKCRGCAVLLMYPYGAPSVQCSSCLFVTKIGVQNQRPPLSMQQDRQQLSANPVH